MGLVVQHNMTAMNANRQLGVTSSAQAKATEKLSSGYRINRAGDDAAGLTISEKMRSQIRGLDKASTNAQDGISLIQSAEGALNEAHSILQRMNELAVQGANDTNQEIDRDAINKELAALTDELDRIAQTTQFNKQELLDGTFTDKKLQVGANSNQNIKISINAMNAEALGLGKEFLLSATEYTLSNSKIGGTLQYKEYVDYTYNEAKTLSYNQALCLSNGLEAISKVYADITDLDSINSDKYQILYNSATGSVAYQVVSTGEAIFEDKVSTVSAVIANVLSFEKKNFSTMVTSQKMFTAEFDVTTWDVTKVEIAKSTKKGYGARVDDYATANKTINKVQKAINIVSEQRSALGALQNRLEHTVANLDTVSENTSAAESRIRDTDMAKMMVEYSKNSILTQAGQSMLAQANQSTQGVLSLLQ